MPRGFTTVYFIGGSEDNTSIEDVQINRLPKNIRFRSENFFATTETDDIAMMKGDLSKDWLSYSVDIYTRSPSDKYKQGTIYSFNETRMVERCSAITQQGHQCSKAAKHEKSYCSEIHKPKGEQ